MTNALTPNDLPERPITPVLSPGLKRLLECEGTDPVYEIVHTPALLAETVAVLPVLKAAATQRAGEAGVKDVVGRRMVLYPQPDRSDGEWAAWWRDYFDVLSDVSWPALEAGMAAWVRDPASEFMPKPGKLLELSMASRNKAHAIFAIAKRVVDSQKPHPVVTSQAIEEPRPEPSEEEKQNVRKMMADFAEKMKVKSPANLRPATPATHGKTDEGGLTAAMREILARRDADAS